VNGKEGLYCLFLESFPGVTEIVNVNRTGTPQRLRYLKDPSCWDLAVTAVRQ
jgi:hypothetical protein